MDVYLGYNQIKMNSSDACKTTFMTNNYNYYYEVMLFGLKNVEVTYQRHMGIVFAYQISRNLEVYIDDMVGKTSEDKNQCDDLKDIME